MTREVIVRRVGKSHAVYLSEVWQHLASHISNIKLKHTIDAILHTVVTIDDRTATHPNSAEQWLTDTMVGLSQQLPASAGIIMTRDALIRTGDDSS